MTWPWATRRMRSIPACAGEPPPYKLPYRQPKVYPRVCGGTTILSAVSFRAQGLSPRVRGNQHRATFCGSHYRSIPACAGEPTCWFSSTFLPTVYPRVCGGTKVNNSSSADENGLSPRVRGNQGEQLIVSRRERSIPACAGEPAKFGGRPRRSTVYPRVCGGTHVSHCRIILYGGLSPRVRGNPSYPICDTPGKRSIPACAGEPDEDTIPDYTRKVYPRVCGGTGSMMDGKSHREGLSPRVRGNQAPVHYRADDLRSIPACAGEPRVRLRSGCRRRVYPRVCGGTTPSGRSVTRTRGLSPRVRGNQAPVHYRADDLRSIPACAGEPR